MSYFTCKPNSGLIVDRPVAGLGRTGRLLSHPQYSLMTHSVRFPKLQKQVYPRLVLVAASQKKLPPLCASSGKVNPEAENDVSLWHVLFVHECMMEHGTYGLI